MTPDTGFSIFALILFIIAFILALLPYNEPAGPVHRGWVIAALIAAGVIVALVVTTGTMVTLH